MSIRQAIAGLPVFGVPVGEQKPIRKEPTVPRVDRLRTSAKLYPCVLCGKDKQFTVSAHGNEVQTKGIGKKAPGYLIAYVCGDPGGCHDLIDGRAGKLPKAKKRAMWREAHSRTVELWFRDGLVVPA